MIGGLTAVLAAACLAACSGSAPAPAGADGATALPVNVTYPAPAAGFAVSHVFSGRIEAARSASLGFELGGLLAAVHVAEGDAVSAGARLATLDTARLQARRRELEAAVAQARSQRELAGRTLERVTEAVSYRGVSRQRVDEARDARDRAAAALALVEAQRDSLDVDLNKSVLYAPFAGTVAVRHLDEGAVVAAGAPVLDIEETGHLQARVGIAGELTRQLQIGDRLQLSAAGEPLAARLAAVLPRRDAVTRTVDIMLDLVTAPAQRVRPGDLVRLTLTDYRPREGWWLPIAALTEGERGLWTALVAVEEQTHGNGAASDGGQAKASWRLQRRVVDLIHLADGRAFVTGLIGRDEPVLLDGTHRVVVGQRVRPVVRAGRSAAGELPEPSPPTPAEAAADDAAGSDGAGEAMPAALSATGAQEP